MNKVKQAVYTSEDNTEIFASQFLTHINIPIVLMNSIYDIF